MVPKGLSIFNMDVTSKGLSWIDNMYQKFETICDEMDESSSLLLQETKMYVEKHVNVVGSNMKKFCAEVIQDILPPSPKSGGKGFDSDAFNDEFELSDEKKTAKKMLQSADSELQQIDFPTGFDSIVDDSSESNNDTVKGINDETSRMYHLSVRETSDGLVFDESIEEDSSVHLTLSAHEQYLDETEDVCKDINEKMRPVELQLSCRNAQNDTQEELFAATTVCTDTTAVYDTVEQRKIKDETEMDPHSNQGEHETDALTRPSDGPLKTVVQDELNSLEEIGVFEGYTLESEGEEEDFSTNYLVSKSCLKEEHLCKGNTYSNECGDMTQKYCFPTTRISETFYPEVLSASEDEADESAFWYGSDEIKKQNFADPAETSSFLVVDEEKLQQLDNCDSEWELL